MDQLARPTKDRPISTVIREHDWLFGTTTKDTKDEVQAMEQALLEVQQWLQAIMDDAEPYCLTLCGVSGVGKSHLAQAAKRWLAKEAEWIYRDKVRPRLDPTGENYTTSYSYAQQGAFFRRWDQDLINPAKDGNFNPLKLAGSDWIKIVDDLGSEQKDGKSGDLKPTAFALGSMTSLIEARVRKWSLYTANYTERGFAETYDVRVADRLIRWPNRIVEIKVRSFALRCKAK